MSNLERLLERGAQCVGGDLVLRHKTVGRFRNGDFFVTEDGMAELDVLEVAAVEVKEPKKPRAKKADAESVQQAVDALLAE